MHTHAGDLNQRQERAAQLRSEGILWNAIAERTGYSPTWVRNLATLPAFDRRVQELTNAKIADALNLLKRNAVRAAEVVIELLETPDEPTATSAKVNEVRLNAATDTLNRLGVTIERDTPAQPLNLDIDISVSVIDAAEQAFIAALRAQSAALGDTLYTGEPSDSRDGILPAIPISGGVPPRPRLGSPDSEGPADGHESGGGA